MANVENSCGMRSKRCDKCGQTKPLGEFYRNVGGKYGCRAWCKVCYCERQRKQDCGRIRISRKPEGWKLTSRELIRRGYVSAYEYIKNNPGRIKANNATNRAIARGTLIRPEQCPFCHKKSRTVAHHEDYSKPLEVVWMCYRCHRLMHHRRRNEFSAGFFACRQPHLVV